MATRKKEKNVSTKKAMDLSEKILDILGEGKVTGADAIKILTFCQVDVIWETASVKDEERFKEAAKYIYDHILEGLKITKEVKNEHGETSQN